MLVYECGAVLAGRHEGPQEKLDRTVHSAQEEKQAHIEDTCAERAIKGREKTAAARVRTRATESFEVAKNHCVRHLLTLKFTFVFYSMK